MIPLGYLVIKRLEETRKKHRLGLVEATSLTGLDEGESEDEYSLDTGELVWLGLKPRGAPHLTLVSCSPIGSRLRS